FRFSLFSFFILRPPPIFTLFPYTTLFRSTPASSAPVLQTPKATSSTLYFDSLTVNAGNGGFLHCIQMDTSVNAANQVDRCIHLNRSEERFSRNAETDLVCRLLLEKKKKKKKNMNSNVVLKEKYYVSYTRP